jgi:hypothetical protein
MVLAASGVEHDELVSIAEPLLSDLPAVKRREEPKSVYVGGDYRCQADSPVSRRLFCSIILDDVFMCASLILNAELPVTRLHTLHLLLRCQVAGAKRKLQ